MSDSAWEKLCYVTLASAWYRTHSPFQTQTEAAFVLWSFPRASCYFGWHCLLSKFGVPFFSRLLWPLDLTERRTSSRDLMRETLLCYCYVVKRLILFRQPFSKRDRSRFCFVKSFEEQAGSWDGSPTGALDPSIFHAVGRCLQIFWTCSFAKKYCNQVMPISPHMDAQGNNIVHVYMLVSMDQVANSFRHCFHK